MNMKKTCWKYCLVCKYLKCKRNWIRWILILIGILVIPSLIIILLIVLPTTLITTFHIPFGCLNTDFTNTGQIGDTIGGITAPIIGLVSIILLYITFREQREFNKKQVEFNEWSSLKDMLSNTEKHLNNIVVGDILENKGNAIPKIKNKSSHIADLYTLIPPYTSDILQLTLKEGYVLRLCLKGYYENLKKMIQLISKTSMYYSIIEERIQASIEKIFCIYDAIEKKNILFQLEVNNLAGDEEDDDDEILIRLFEEDKALFEKLPSEYLPKWYKQK